MKKIFAFVLASIMVLSLVPASAFAAITKDCPETHNLDNCEYTFVETVIPSCKDGGYGYTVYECNVCGERFLADFVETLAHIWVSSADGNHKNTTASCKGNGTVGKEYLKCKICSAPYNGPYAVKDGDFAYKKTDPDQAHKLNYVSGYGCEAQYKCSVCSGTFYGVDENGYAKKTASHTWEFTKVVKEPEIVNGVGVEGSALYTCKDCKDTKLVQIFAPECKCDGYESIFTTKIVSYKAATCEADGTYPVYKCSDCNQLYKTNKDGKNFVAIEKVEDAVIPAKGHDDSDGRKAGAYNCESTFTCKTCKKTITERDHGGIVEGAYVAPDYVFVTEYSTADCTNYGYLVWLCNYCGDNEAVFTPPSGHTTETVIVPSTCGTYGYIYTYCTNEWCTLTAEAIHVVYGIPYEVAVDGEPVKVVSLVRNTVLDENAHDFALIANQTVSCDQPGLEVYKCKFCNKMTYETVPASGHEFDESKTEYKPADCINPGYIRKYCKNCKSYVDTAIAATPGIHNYELTESYHHCIVTTVPTVQQRPDGTYLGREVYSCTGCGTQITVYVDKLTTGFTGTKWFENLEAAELYHYGNKKLVDGVWTYAFTDTLVKQNTLCVPSTCYSNGYDVYKCSSCDQLVYVTAEKLPHTNFKTTPAKASTCKATGNIEYNTCYVCNTNFIFVDAEGEQISLYKTVDDKKVLMTAAEIAVATANAKQKDLAAGEQIIKAHASLLGDKKTVTDCAGNVIGTYYVCGGKDCGKKFTDKTASTIYNGPTKNSSHTWTNVVPYVAATCNATGTVGVQYCTVCSKYQVIYNYIYENESGELSIKKSSTVYNTAEDAEITLPAPIEGTLEIYIAADGTIKANAISIPKFEHAYDATTGTYAAILSEKVNADDCSKPSYTHNYCIFCEYEYLTDYRPASSADGHVNEYGELLKGDCAYLETLESLNCFYCDYSIDKNDIHSYLSQDIEVAATCTTDGYVYNYCVDCGRRKVVKVFFADADAYHAIDKTTGIPVNGELVGVAKDYANAGDYYYVCNDCGKQLTKTVKEDAPKEPGVEIVLSLDSDKYVIGSTIYVTVSLDSYKGVNVWGLDFNLNYDPAVVEFLDEETVWVTTNFTEAHDAAQQTEKVVVKDEDGKETVTRVPTGVVKVAANAKENVLVKGSQDLVVLAFKVVNPTAPGANFLVPAYEAQEDPFFGGFAGFASAVTVVDEKGNAVNALYNDFDLNAEPDFDNYESWEAAYIYEGENVGELAQATIRPLLDVDGNYQGGNDLNMADILALYELIVFNEYDVAADTDFNGVINMVDLANAYHVLVGRTTVEALAGVIPSDWIPAEGAKND